MPDCYIIAGSNGAGKTTFAREFLPRYVKCLNFINPDLIAAGLSPFDASRAMQKAGRLVLDEIRIRTRKKESFGFETTLSGRLYARTIDDIRSVGYQVHLFYLWIPDSNLAMMRIRERVSRGGHDVPEEDVKRRFSRSLSNLFRLYRNRLDSLYFYDNATDKPQLVFLEEGGAITICNQRLYDQIICEVNP
jgi:predicted ABC-type ATPase